MALLSLGTRLAECLKAAEDLGALGLSTTVADARFAKPLDMDLITRLAREHEVLITVEEGSIGGFGSFVLHALSDAGLMDGACRVRSMVLPDVYLDHDKPRPCMRRPASMRRASSPRSSRRSAAAPCRRRRGAEGLSGKRARADVVLVERGFYPSRARAQEAIAAGLVTVGGRPLARASQDIPDDAVITAEQPHPWVSRGGVKLAAALDAFGVNPAGRSCLDVGSSTGGFSHVLLTGGARPSWRWTPAATSSIRVCGATRA